MWEITATMPTSVTKFLLELSLYFIHASLGAANADVLVRIEREARETVNVKKFAWTVLLGKDVVGAGVRASRSLRTGTSALPAIRRSPARRRPQQRGRPGNKLNLLQRFGV
jgi:hypothetical protein